MSSIFFILGAGASVDSGLYTYRGANRKYDNYDEIVELLDGSKWNDNKYKIWDYLEEFNNEINKIQLGETYKLIDQLYKKFPKSFVLTQNIDGLIKNINVPSIEMHGSLKYMKCIACNNMYDIDFKNKHCSCGELCKPDVILYNEDLDKRKMDDVYKLIKKNKPDYLIIIGTSLQFSYLDTFIKKSKVQKMKRFHINPDENYKCNKGENFIGNTSNDGLRMFLTDDNIILN